jgi:hypothetical protein
MQLSQIQNQDGFLGNYKESEDYFPEIMFDLKKIRLYPLVNLPG